MEDELYRARHETIIYDDDYGIWTEQDQVSVAADVFQLFDKHEDLGDLSWKKLTCNSAQFD